VPETQVHDRITIVSAALLTPVVLAVPSDNRWLSWGALIGAHLFSGLLLSNDLDIRAIEYRRWGPFRWIWWPYERLVPHRSWVSHGLVVGPLLRLAYLALAVDLCVVLVALAVCGTGGDGLGLMHRWHAFWAQLVSGFPRRFGEGLLGLVLGGALHSIPDWMQTTVRRTI
jgi:uncharacterized metal-binding protein